MNLMKMLTLNTLWLMVALPLSVSAQSSSVKVSTDASWSVRMAESDMIRNPDPSMLDFVKAPK